MGGLFYFAYEDKIIIRVYSHTVKRNSWPTAGTLQIADRQSVGCLRRASKSLREFRDFNRERTLLSSCGNHPRNRVQTLYWPPSHSGKILILTLLNDQGANGAIEQFGQTEKRILITSDTRATLRCLLASAEKVLTPLRWAYLERGSGKTSLMSMLKRMDR